MSPARAAARAAVPPHRARGTVGAGASMKLAINLPLLVFWQAFGEALALCRSLGLEPQNRRYLCGYLGGRTCSERAAGLAAALQARTGPVTVDIDAMRKDLRTMVEEADRSGPPCRSPRARWNAMTRRRARPGQGRHHGDPVALDEEVVGHASRESLHRNHSVELREAFAPGRLQKIPDEGAGAPPRRWWHRTGAPQPVFPMRRAITYP